MKTFFLLAPLLYFIATTGGAAIAVQPLEQLVPTAEIVVVGKLTQAKDADKEHRGHITVTRALRGKGLKAGDKVEVRWAPKPVIKDPKLAHVADYTFRPTLGKEGVFVLQPRPKGQDKKPRPLNWGSQHPVADEAKIKKLVALGSDADFIGKTEQQAKAMAKERKIVLRVMMRDGEAMIGTADYRTDRLNLTLEKGRIVKVNRG